MAPICNASPFVLLNGAASSENLSRCWTLMAALLLTRDSSARCWSIAHWSGLVQLPTTSLASTNPEARPLPDWTWGQCRQSGSPPQREQSLPTPQTDEWSAPPYARQPAPPTDSASYGAKNATPTRRDAPFPTLGYPPEKVQRHHLEIISVRTDCSMEFPPSLRRESGTCIKGPARLQNTGV